MCLQLPRGLIGALIVITAGVAFEAHAETFKNPQLIQTTYDPQAVATADLNGDGVPDIVYTDGISPYALHVLLGNSDGTFSHKADIVLPGGVGPIINLADVTNDGVIDIIVGGATSSGGEIAVLPGKGDGTFGAAVITSVSHNGSNGGSASFDSNIAIGDVNGDGIVDLVAADFESATIYVLLGDNTGKFTLSSMLGPYYFTGRTQTYLHDLNGDGDLDIVVNDSVGGVTYVLLGNGSGSFQSETSYNSRALLFTDVNGDGYPDLVGTASPGQVQVLLGNSNGTFGSPTVIATVPSSDYLVGAGDFNGDGITDLLLISPAGVAVALGKGNLAFGDATASVAGSLLPGYFFNDLGVAKFGGNSYSDVAIAVEGGLTVLASNGDGTFASGDAYDLGTTVGTVSVADFNGDKLPDIAVSVSATYPRVLLGNGAGEFSLAADQNQTYTTTAPSGSMVAADFNGDGKSDIDMLESGQPFILYGEGDAMFDPPVAINTGPSLVGDFSNDGRSDMISISDDGILVLLGQGNDTFASVTTPVNYPTSRVAAIGDVNGDGKLDALTVENNSLRVWLGNGDGTFTQANLLNISLQQVNEGSVTLADVDGDGILDIVIVPYPNQGGLPFPLVICYGNGDGTFQAGVSLSISHFFTQLVVADVNQDQKPDLIMTDGSLIAVIEGQGNRTFGAEQHFVAGQQISGLTVTDVNGDGFPDIVAANDEGTTAVVLLNEPKSNAPQGAVSGGSLSVSPNPAQYSQPLTLSLTLSVASGPVPTGSVSFGIDGAFLISTALVSGKASHAYSAALNTGSHTVTATYNGDDTYASENFTTLLTVQSPVYPTSTVLVASPTTVYTSQTVRLTATVTANSAAVPQGNVTFLDGTTTLGVQQIYSNSPIELDTNLLSAGTHSLTAVYQGWQDPFNEQAIYQPSTSSPVQVIVNAAGTATSLTPSATSATAGTLITFSASVTSSSGVPFGGVTFYDGSTALGSSSLEADGSCSFTTASLATGTHTITATFNANATFAASTSASSTITINAAASNLVPTAVAVVAGANSNQFVLQAFVASRSGSVAGQVNFLDGGSILGTAVVDDSGMALLALSALSPGVHSFFADFSGNLRFAPSVSPVLTEQLPDLASGFALTLSSHSLDLTTAAVGNLLVTVLASHGFRQPVKLSCAEGVPKGYECVFSPSSLSSGVSHLRIESSVADLSSSQASILGTGALGILALMLFVANQTKRRRVTSAFAAIIFALTIGCGTRSSEIQRQITVLSIRATAGAGANRFVDSAQVLVVFDSH
jgi:hypothetical protein